MTKNSTVARLECADPEANPEWAGAPSEQPPEYSGLAAKIKTKYVREGVAFPFIGSSPIIVAPLILRDTPEERRDHGGGDPKGPAEALGVWLDCRCPLAAFHAEFLQSEKFISATFPADPRIKLVTLVHAKCGDCDRSPAIPLERDGASFVEARTEREGAHGLLGRFACRIGAYDTSKFEQQPDCPCRGDSERTPELGARLHLEASMSLMRHLANSGQLSCTAEEGLKWVLDARDASSEYGTYSSYLTRQQSSELIRHSGYFVEQNCFAASRPSGTCATTKTVLDIVSSATGIAKEIFLGDSREGDIVFCRQLAAYIFRRTSGRSYKRIAELLRREDHTTTMNGCQRIASFMGQHPFHHAFVRMLVERADEIGALRGRAFLKK